MGLPRSDSTAAQADIHRGRVRARHYVRDDRLTGIKGPITAKFQYDATDRRTRKTINGLTTDFLHDAITSVTESSPGGTGFLLTDLRVDDFMLRIGPVSTSIPRETC